MCQVLSLDPLLICARLTPWPEVIGGGNEHFMDMVKQYIDGCAWPVLLPYMAQI